MAIYVEYISRRQGIALDGFQQIARSGQPGWASSYDDLLILNVGRTWRLGPEPEYMAVWHTPAAGLERLGEWAAIFETHEADHLELSFNAVGRIDEAGLYDALLEPVPGRGGPLYVAEYFDITPGASRDDVADFYQSRAAARPDLTLNLVADRVGTLGPDPRGLAFWQLPGYDALEPLARELQDGADRPVQVLRSGLYADIGEEIL